MSKNKSKSLPTTAEAEEAVRTLLRYVGEDLNREALRDTPKRVIAAYNEWFSGYAIDPSSIFTTFEDGGEDYDELILLTNIPVFSTCIHHLCPFYGRAAVGYIPGKDGRIVGISKLARLVDIYSRRLQVQEAITTSVAKTLFKCLHPIGVGVILQCKHLCLESRGIHAVGTITTTCSLLGGLRKSAARNEFLKLVEQSSNKSI
jgi:GTP cyclohydrolase I